MSRILVFFPTYNEAGNVEPLVAAIRAALPDGEVLVVDDASPDGTGEILDRLALADPRLRVIHRPGKLGLGSAHKLALLYARDGGFDALITMDADFSHHPRYLPTFAEHLERAEFVIGSRYAPGGRSDYALGRQIISRTANWMAKVALGLPLAEHTTMYRGFSASLLRRLDIEGLRSEGYSFAVECVHRVSLATDRIVEFPIHFENRAAGASKISQAEIVKAVLTIHRLGLGRLVPRPGTEDPRRADPPPPPPPCVSCGGTQHTLEYPAREGEALAIADASPYSCATHSSRSHGRILRCLGCGLVFMEPRLTRAELVREYEQTEDPVYVEQLPARLATFRHNLAQVRRHLAPQARLLEVGSYCGAFLRVARDEGFDVMGVEPSRWAARISRGLVDAKVHSGTLDTLPDDIEPFDAIAAWDVLEHFADPVAELRKMHARLRPGGTLLLSTLMIDNWFPRATGKHWPWLMDMHLFYFTETTIANVLEQTGFEIVESSKYCHIVSLEYLVAKLGTLGVPLADRAGAAAAASRWAKTEIPFRFGDIQLFVCRKAPDSEEATPDSALRPSASARPALAR